MREQAAVSAKEVHLGGHGRICTLKGEGLQGCISQGQFRGLTLQHGRGASRPLHTDVLCLGSQCDLHKMHKRLRDTQATLGLEAALPKTAVCNAVLLVQTVEAGQPRQSRSVIVLGNALNGHS